MAHAITTYSDLKLGDIADAYRWINRDRAIDYQEMMRRYEFIWGFFKEVAVENGLVIPWTWFGAEKISAKHRYTKYKSTKYLEPLGPTTMVDHEVFNGAYLMHMAASAENLAYTCNWTKVARRFFMVDKNARQVMTNSGSTQVSAGPVRIGLIAEKWRVIEPRPGKQLISKK